MSKVFFSKKTYTKEFRKIEPLLKLTWFYIWTNCDESGVYVIDEDLFEFENGFEFDLENFANSFKEQVEIEGNKILLKEYIKVNYVNLKKDYNPHKPCFRAINKNLLKVNSSLNQASFKLIDEDVDVDEDKEEGVEVIEDSKSKEKTKPKFNFKNSLIEYGFNQEYVDEWLMIRKSKKAVNSEFSLKTFISQVEETKADKNEILKLVIENQWKSFKASWYLERQEKIKEQTVSSGFTIN